MLIMASYFYCHPMLPEEVISLTVPELSVLPSYSGDVSSYEKEKEYFYQLKSQIQAITTPGEGISKFDLRGQMELARLMKEIQTLYVHLLRMAGIHEESSRAYIHMDRRRNRKKKQG